MYEICAQAVGIAAMAFNILSFQMKTPGQGDALPTDRFALVCRELFYA